MQFWPFGRKPKAPGRTFDPAVDGNPNVSSMPDPKGRKCRDCVLSGSNPEPLEVVEIRSVMAGPPPSYMVGCPKCWTHSEYRDTPEGAWTAWYEGIRSKIFGMEEI